MHECYNTYNIPLLYRWWEGICADAENHAFARWPVPLRAGRCHTQTGLFMLLSNNVFSFYGLSYIMHVCIGHLSAGYLPAGRARRAESSGGHQRGGG
jgi:hypothetical protein